MAKKKTRILWLSKDWQYGLWFNEPILQDGQFKGEWCDDFCPIAFNKLCYALKLRKNTKYKLKLTNLKNGIKLEKVK